MSSLYEDFQQCKGKWHNSVVLKTIKTAARSTRRGTRRWVTKKQMLQIFDNDQEVVKSIILRKEMDDELRATEIRHHPELPGLGGEVTGWDFHNSCSMGCCNALARFVAVPRSGGR